MPFPLSPALRPINRRTLLWASVLLFIGTIGVYASGIQNGFVNFDDPDYVTANAHVLAGLHQKNVVWSFGTDNAAANWHPLTWMSHMLDVSLYGLNPAGHHFTNIFLHALDSALLFVILALGTGFAGRSAVVAALFAVHPLNVEAVEWVAERKSVLCLLFFFLAIWAYGAYTRRPSLGRYFAVVILYALALLSKIMVITLPAALLLLDIWPLQRFRLTAATGKLRTAGTLLLEKLPLFALSAAAGWMTIRIHRREGALAATMPLGWRFENALYSYAKYLWKLLWPSKLAVFYPHPEGKLSNFALILSAAVLLAICISVWLVRRKQYVLVGWLWYLGTMMPMSGIVQSGRQGMADRYMYIPMIGILVALVWLASECLDWLQWSPRAAGTLALAVVLPCVSVTQHQLAFWKNSVTLFAHTVEVTEPNGLAENNLGNALMNLGQRDLALPHLENAVRYSPDLASAHYNLGVLYQLQNRGGEAAREYRAAIAVFTDDREAARAHNNLGFVYLDAGDARSAEREFNRAISLNPAEHNSFIGRGRLELQSARFDEAIKDFAHAANLAPSAGACVWLGRGLEAKGDFENAAKAYSEALRIAPGFEEAQERLSRLESRVR